MSGRPEILFPLFEVLTSLDGVGPKMAQNFAGLGVEKPKDLILTLPHSVVDRRVLDTLHDVPSGRVVTVRVMVDQHYPAKSKWWPPVMSPRDRAAPWTWLDNVDPP